eukprot:1027140-Alexandrium_andersonii.AAC.1
MAFGIAHGRRCRWIDELALLLLALPLVGPQIVHSASLLASPPAWQPAFTTVLHQASLWP